MTSHQTLMEAVKEASGICRQWTDPESGNTVSSSEFSSMAAEVDASGILYGGECYEVSSDGTVSVIVQGSQRVIAQAQSSPAPAGSGSTDAVNRPVFTFDSEALKAKTGKATEDAKNMALGAMASLSGFGKGLKEKAAEATSKVSGLGMKDRLGGLKGKGFGSFGKSSSKQSTESTSYSVPEEISQPSTPSQPASSVPSGGFSLPQTMDRSLGSNIGPSSGGSGTSSDSGEAPAPAKSTAADPVAGKFSKLMDAADAASTFCSSWYFFDDETEHFDLKSLKGMAEISDQEESLDYDEWYIVLKDGSIGRQEEGGMADWLFVPLSGQDKEILEAFMGEADDSLIGYSKMLDDPEILDAARKRASGIFGKKNDGLIWEGTVINKQHESETVKRGYDEDTGERLEDVHNRYTITVARYDGQMYTMEEGDDNPNYTWVHEGDRVRYLPMFDMLEKYDKSKDSRIPCMVCRKMNKVDPDQPRCFSCKLPLFK
ncbi:MAG: hypothetical protein E7Z70_07450 [Thermoplasmata archaeon]|nr:hypothetical protein [Thermoplasmata archaeon]